jgi:transcriptional regulator with XRE-family HTH domain
MALSHKVKLFRKAKGISQESMAEKLYMSQSTYYRLENSDHRCAKHLSRIADALETTIDVLQAYHLTNQQEAEFSESIEIQLAEKEALIENLHVENTFLKHYTTYLHSVWDEYCLRHSELPVLSK